VSAPATGSRPRPARRAIDDLSFPVDRTELEPRLRAASLPDDRLEALAAYETLPGESNQLYTTYIDLRPASLGSATTRWDPLTRPVPVPVPGGADGLLVFTEGDLTAAALSPAATSAGVELTSIADYLERHPEPAAELVRTGGLPADDKFAQLTRALWSQGAVLDIPAGVHLRQPIVIRWAVGAPDRALFTRTLISLGDGAEARVVEELVPSGEAVAGRQCLLAGTSEVRLGAGARLAMASLQELGPDVVALQHRVAQLGEAAELHWALAQLGGRLVRSRIDNRLEGDRSSAEQVEIVFGGDDQSFDLTSYTRHVGRDTTGNLLSKGALLDRSRSAMKGLITIEKSAVGTDSFLGEFGMNLSKTARSVAIPSLEIDQPDCRRAAHSSSVGPIDETQLFYLESRGIPPDEARKFIVLGFLEPVVARVPLAEAQERLRGLLEAKWAAGSGAAESAA